VTINLRVLSDKIEEAFAIIADTLSSPPKATYMVSSYALIETLIGLGNLSRLLRLR